MSSCEDCDCPVRQDIDPVGPSVQRTGQFAVVFDAPTSSEAAMGHPDFNSFGNVVFGAVLRGVMAQAGTTPPKNLLDEVAVFHAVSRPTPGGKPPKVSAIRSCRERLIDDLREAAPRAVLSIGAAACSALAGGVATPISKWRGQMRWLDLCGTKHDVPEDTRVRPDCDGPVVPWVPTISASAVAMHPDLARDISYDVWKAWNQPAPLPPPDVETHVVRSVDELYAALELLEGASVVTCDVETTGLSSYRNRLLSVGFGATYDDESGVAVIVPRELLSDPAVLDACWDTTYRRSRRTVFQNGKYDLQFLSRWLGEDIPDDAFLGDTLLLGYLLDERPNQPTRRVRGLGLKEQASIRYDQEDYHWDWAEFYGATALHDQWAALPDEEKGEEPLDADWAGLYAYQALDVFYTARLWHDLIRDANAESPRLMEAHEDVLIPAMRTLARCEMAGAPLNFAWLETFAARLRRRIYRRQTMLERVAPSLGCPEGFNVGSPAQVADVMYDVWKMTPDVRKKKGSDPTKADRSVDKDHIDAAVRKYKGSTDSGLRSAAKWLQTLINWRADKKNLSTYSESLMEKADDDGRIRAGFLIHGTLTGRLSSQGPNLQNIPAVDDKRVVNGRTIYTLRHGRTTYWPARKGFAPRPGSVWVEADYGQLELRVAAALSGDPDFTQVFVNKRDIHREVAATMFSKPPDQISKPERYLAKAVDFGILYGRTGKALSLGAEMDFYERELGGRRWDEPTANAFIAKFLRGYPKLSEWLESTAENAVVDQYVETPFGRRRRFPMPPRTKYDKLEIGRQATNTPIQSAASDLCLGAMARIIPRLPDGATVLFPVHDSICIEVREDLLPEVEKICREEMEIDFMGVPLEIDFEWGPTWADVG